MRSWAGLSGRIRLKEGPTLRFYLLVSWELRAEGANVQNRDVLRSPPETEILSEGARHAAT